MKRNILLVEDDDTAIRLMKELLSKQYNVHTARNGMEGLSILTENISTIELIVTDFRMPAMNGKEMLEAIWQIYPTIKAVMVTADYGKPELQNLNNVTILAKPIDFHDLFSSIEMQLL